MKKLTDTLTVLLLAAAFGMAYYTGFVGELANGKPMLGTDVFAIISMLGMLVLFIIGPVSALVSRAKNNLITTGFIVFFCAQVLALVALCTAMIMLWTNMFNTDSSGIRAIYIICTVIGIAGFVDALLFSDCLAARDAALEGDAEAEDDAEDYEEEAEEEYEEETEEESEEEENSENNADSGNMFLGF